VRSGTEGDGSEDIALWAGAWILHFIDPSQEPRGPPEVRANFQEPQASKLRSRAVVALRGIGGVKMDISVGRADEQPRQNAQGDGVAKVPALWRLPRLWGGKPA
jgi:hypothetical protein